jgi:hypothetical protein
VIRFIGSSIIVSLNYNHITADNRWLPKTHSILSWTMSVFHCDWLAQVTSVLQIPLLSTTPVRLTLDDEFSSKTDWTAEWTPFYNLVRTGNRTPPLNGSFIVIFVPVAMGIHVHWTVVQQRSIPRCHRNKCLPNRCSATVFSALPQECIFTECFLWMD